MHKRQIAVSNETFVALSRNVYWASVLFTWGSVYRLSCGHVLHV